jgi:CRP-like cAMP-binding protein
MNTHTKLYKAGTHLFYQGDRSRELYILQSGRVKIYIKVGDKKLDLAMLTKNAVLGEMALIDGKPRSASAIACEDTQAIIVDTDFFNKRISGVPSWYISLIKTTCEKIRKANSRLEIIKTKNRFYNIFIVLKYLFIKYGKKSDNQINMMEAEKTIQQLMFILSESYASVSKALDILQRNNIIEIKDKNILLISELKLNELCAYLKNKFRKFYEKTKEIPPQIKKLIISIHDLCYSKQNNNLEKPEISKEDMLIALEKCQLKDNYLEAIKKLKELSLIEIQKAEETQKEQKEKLLDGQKFIIVPENFFKIYLYCYYKDMVEII